MANWKSDQRTNEDAVPQVWAKPNESSKVRRKFFSWYSASIPAAADTIEFCKIPKGARLLGGIIKFEAFGTSVTMALGDGTTAAKYMAQTSIAAIGSATFGDTVALYFGEEVAADFTLTGTTAGATMTTLKKLYGYIEYLVDG